MRIEIQERTGVVQAMGHSVSPDQGGEAELRRRCFETLSRLNTPPDEVQFVRMSAVTRLSDINRAPVPAGSTRPALLPGPPDPPALDAPAPPLAPAQPPTDPATPRSKRRLGR